MRFEIFVFFVTECSSFFNSCNILMQDFGISPNENSTEISSLPSKKPKPENQSSSATFLCRQFDDDQKLYDRLSKTDHNFNSKLIANTIDEVVWKMNDDFQDQLLFFDETNDQDGTYNDGPIFNNETIIESTCDQKCRKSRDLFARILKSQLNVELWNSSNLEQSFFDSDTRKKFSCNKPDKIIKIGNCRSKVKIDNYKFISLCPICRFLYKLPDYCFPRYINALHCHSESIDFQKSTPIGFSNHRNFTCIHESWSRRAHGKCVQKTTNLMIMRNVGDRSCPDWTLESLATPINCECFLNTGSWLKS